MLKLKQNKILEITVTPQSKQIVLEKIKKYLNSPTGFFHITSLNPENLVVAQENKEFKKVIETAQIKIIDGVGIVLAARILGIDIGERYPGVELMKDLIKLALDGRLRVLLIGGRPNLADSLAKCYSRQFSKAKFKGVYGIKDIKKPERKEEKKIFSIVATYKPHLLFVAFGSPDQELWLTHHKKEFSGVVAMGVGGSFDYLSDEVSRAPIFIQKLGLEWFYRLINQPWRWKRQVRLLRFIGLVFKEKWTKI